jgi:ZIP family zinc transporter
MILPWALVCAAILGLGLPLGASISRPGRVAALVGRLIGPLAVGVLVFVLWDVLSEAFLPLDGALEQWIDGLAGPGPVTPLVVGFFVGLVAGFGVLAAAETWRARGCSVTVIGAGWAARGVIAGLVLGSASTSEDLALSVLAVIGLILAQGIHGADSGPQLPRRSVWLLAALAVIFAVAGVLVGQGFPNDTSAVGTLAVSVGIWAAGTGALTYVIFTLIPRFPGAGRHPAACAGVLVGLGLAFGANLLLMLAAATA